MKVDRIAFEQLYPTGVYANQRFRAEGTLQDGDDIVECYRKLAAEVDKAFSAMHPEIKWEEPSKKEEPIDKRVAAIIEDINQCTGIHSTGQFGVEIGLIAYEDVANTHPEIKAAYDLKMALLKKNVK